MSLVDNTVLVQRANVVAKIDRSQLTEYKNKGYDVIDAQGNVIEKAVPTDVLTLQAEYKRQEKEILALRDEVKTLKAQLKDAKKKTKAND